MPNAATDGHLVARRRYTVVIADDEPLARRRLRQLLDDAEDFEVVSEAADGQAAVEATRAASPDVVFLDVQMPALDGFAVLGAFGDRSPYVVFVTAFPEHAHRAFDVDAVDYLVKPVTRARFATAMSRARRALGRDTTPASTLIEQVQRALQHPTTTHATRIFVPGGRRDVIVPATSIDWLGADGAYVHVHETGRTHLLRDSLAAVLSRLDPRQFVQVHRSAAVNLDRVRETRRSADGGLSLVLTDGSRMTVSRRRSDEVLRSLGRVGRGAP